MLALSGERSLTSSSTQREHRCEWFRCRITVSRLSDYCLAVEKSRLTPTPSTWSNSSLPCVLALIFNVFPGGRRRQHWFLPPTHAGESVYHLCVIFVVATLAAVGAFGWLTTLLDHKQFRGRFYFAEYCRTWRNHPLHCPVSTFNHLLPKSTTNVGLYHRFHNRLVAFPHIARKSAVF